MKLLIVIVVIVQLSLAEKTYTKIVQPPNDKLYPIFDLIATKMQEHSKLQCAWLAGIANEIVPDFKDFMKTHNTEEYKEFNDAFLKAFNSAEQFTKDPDNCRLQRAAYNDVMTISELKPAADDLKDFFRSLGEKKNLKAEGDKTAIRDISKQMPDLIKKFIESLNEEEKQKSPKLYKAGVAILKAGDGGEKFDAIQSFMREALYDKNLAEANDENCKWDLTNFDEFVMNVLHRAYYYETD